MCFFHEDPSVCKYWQSDIDYNRTGALRRINIKIDREYHSKSKLFVHLFKNKILKISFKVNNILIFVSLLIENIGITARWHRLRHAPKPPHQGLRSPTEGGAHLLATGWVDRILRALVSPTE